MDADKKRIWIRGQYVEVTDEVYRAYMQGDRKMRYFENDLKTERFVLGKEGQVVQIIPSREDSLDRLVDEAILQRAGKCGKRGASQAGSGQATYRAFPAGSRGTCADPGTVL